MIYQVTSGFFVGVDFNAGEEEVMGKYGLGARNDEGEMAVQFAIKIGTAFLNTFSRKKREH